MDNVEKLMDTMENLVQILNDTELAIPNIKQGINPDAYYTVEEIKKILDVSTRTIQTWRDKHRLIYVQIKLNGEESPKGKVYFQGKDLIDFLNSNKRI